MDIVEFSVQVEPPCGRTFPTVRCSAEFAKAPGERIVLTREKQVETSLLREPFTAAWLLSHILQDFMAEAGLGAVHPLLADCGCSKCDCDSQRFVQ